MLGVAAVVGGVAACFAIGTALAGGGSSPAPARAVTAGMARRGALPAPPTVPVAPTEDFSASGTGSGTTVPFHPAGPWALTYQVTCPGATVATASFTVASAGVDIAGFDTSVVASASGNRAGLPSGPMAITVAVPVACSWTVTAQVAASTP